MNPEKLSNFRKKWNWEASERLRMMTPTVTDALQALELPLGHRATWLRSCLECNAGSPASKMYQLYLLGADMEEDLGQLTPLEEDQIGPYDKEVEILLDAIQEARDFWHKFRNEEMDL